MEQRFSLSANIEEGFSKDTQYIVTPNVQKSMSSILDSYRSGIHTFTIIGTYGTGKSSFLLALESDLTQKKHTHYLLTPENLSKCKGYEFMNIVGDYAELSSLIRKKMSIEGEGNSVLDELKAYYNKLHKSNKFLVIVIDEFGKVLEHAAKNNPEQELYFMQKLAEFVNVPSRNILLLTTLHQNFSSYARGLKESQVNEWTKVKGRFKEIAFVEPIEQILSLASSQLYGNEKEIDQDNAKQLYDLAVNMGYVSKSFSIDTAYNLYPMDTISSVAITSAIQRYGQNERSLFTFLAAKGSDSLSEFVPKDNLTYNLQMVYNYVQYNFYSYLKDANADSMAWSSISVSIDRTESQQWESREEMLHAVNFVKAIGLLNLFGPSTFTLNREDLSLYAKYAMGINDAMGIIKKLEAYKIVRFAEYKKRLMLFEGTDINIEEEIAKAGLIVSRPTNFIDDLIVFFNKRISPVKAHYYQKGTPRFFDYEIREDAVEMIPSGDTDGFIQLIFSTKKNAMKDLLEFSKEHEGATIYAYFNNTDEIVEHLYGIEKYKYILEKVLIDSADRVAINEIKKLKEYEEEQLNKTISDNLFQYKGNVTWIFNGHKQTVSSMRDFNKLLSKVCDEVYSKTPIMNNELFNKHKLSGTISSAKAKYLNAMINHGNEDDWGFDKDKFPPEKTIYYSLLKNTGLHVNGCFADKPSNDGIMTLWNASEEFIERSVSQPRKISELIKILSNKPYKLKQGFIDFWIPTYLYIKRQDYALYDSSKGAYMPNVNEEFFDLLQKHPGDFSVKAFAVDGVKLGFFNQYRKFVNLGDEFNIQSDKFVETIKPFLFFYKRLNEYTRNTKKFEHQSTMRFRDVLASAKDPEKAFFEDLPEALGFNKDSLKQERSIDEYGAVIQRAIKELRSCYTRLIDRIEERIVEGLGLDSYEYTEYVKEIRDRLANVKVYLLTDRQREFYHHIMTEYDNRTLWYQSICYTAIENRLDSLRDDQEDKLADELIFLFRECEKYADISKHINSETDKFEAYSFDMVTNKGTNVKTQTYVLPENEKEKSEKLKMKIENLLSGDNNLDVCTLLAIINEKIKK